MVTFISPPVTEPLFGGFALKLIVNAVSTGANVLKGRVYGNTMINLTVANDKVSCYGYRIHTHVSGLVGIILFISCSYSIAQLILFLS